MVFIIQSKLRIIVDWKLSWAKYENLLELNNTISFEKFFNLNIGEVFGRKFLL